MDACAWSCTHMPDTYMRMDAHAWSCFHMRDTYMRMDAHAWSCAHMPNTHIRMDEWPWPTPSSAPAIPSHGRRRPHLSPRVKVNRLQERPLPPCPVTSLRGVGVSGGWREGGRSRRAEETYGAQLHTPAAIAEQGGARSRSAKPAAAEMSNAGRHNEWLSE
eukprot:356907-Chlamydomonas_euryale.AAC.8